MKLQPQLSSFVDSCVVSVKLIVAPSLRALRLIACFQSSVHLGISGCWVVYAVAAIRALSALVQPSYEQYACVDTCHMCAMHAAWWCTRAM